MYFAQGIHRLLSLTILSNFANAGDDGCVSESSPNPIYKDYTFEVSGNLNGTTMVIPIPLSTAQELVGQKYSILEDAYREKLPDFPADMYPMMAVTALDHDIHFPALGLSTPDFSFPFIDLLGDGYSNFRMAKTMIITAGSLAILGSELYGTKVYAGDFEPSCNGYEASSNGSTSFSATAAKAKDDVYLSLEVSPAADSFPYPLSFLKNITNQPAFANSFTCDNYKRIFNTSLTTGDNEPVEVKGSMSVLLDPLTKAESYTNVYGWRLATSFLEPPIPKTCKSLRGYGGTGSGDSG